MNPSPKATPIRPKALARFSGLEMSASTAPAVAAVPPLTPSISRAVNNRAKGMVPPAAQGRACQLMLTVMANSPNPSTDPATQAAITGRRP